MLAQLSTYDHYGYAAAAFFGTILCAWALLLLVFRSRWSAALAGFHGIVPPFLNVAGVLFALTLAFLANDTWNAHDRALGAVFQEADSLSGIVALAVSLPPAVRAKVDDAVRGYARSVAEEEWPLLTHRKASTATAERLDRLLELLAADDTIRAAAPAVHAQMLNQAMQVRATRDLRIALSRTHVNPLKWLGMAFLGLMTMATIALVHVDQPRAAFMAVLLFALAATPTATIVLVQANPFQQPLAVTPGPITVLVESGRS